MEKITVKKKMLFLVYLYVKSPDAVTFLQATWLIFIDAFHYIMSLAFITL